MSTIDYTKAPEEILTAIINARRGLSLLASQLTFGIPSVNVGARNTIITLTAKPGSGFVGQATITYDRRDIAAVPGDKTRTFTPAGAVSISELIPQINAAWQINLSTADIVDGPLPAFTPDTPGDTKSFTLVIDSDCMIYNGSIPLKIRRQDIPLSSIIGVTDLGELAYP